MHCQCTQQSSGVQGAKWQTSGALRAESAASMREGSALQSLVAQACFSASGTYLQADAPCSRVTCSCRTMHRPLPGGQQLFKLMEVLLTRSGSSTLASASRQMAV